VHARANSLISLLIQYVFFFLALDIETTGSAITENPMIAFGACVVSVDDVAVPDADCEFLALMPMPFNNKDDDDDDADDRAVDALVKRAKKRHRSNEKDGDYNNTGKWESRCFAEFWNKEDEHGGTPLRRLIALQGKYGTLSLRDAIDEFLEWTAAMYTRFERDGNKIMVVVDTAAFDTTWLNDALAKYSNGRVPSLLYLRGDHKYRPVRDVTSFHMGIARQTPAMGFFGADKAALKTLAIDEWPASVRAIEHDHNPLNDAKSIALKAAFIAHKLEVDAAAAAAATEHA